MDPAALVASVAVVFGVGYTIYLNKIHEKEIATRAQKNLSFGVTVFAGLAGAAIGLAQIFTYPSLSTALIWMAAGGFVDFATGLPIFLSFRKGIVYGVR